MIADEKKRIELDAQVKSNKSIEVIGHLKADLDTANLKIGELEYEVANVSKQNQWFEEVRLQTSQGRYLLVFLTLRKDQLESLGSFSLFVLLLNE